MNITFEDITKANEGLTSVNIKGKEYIVVPQRIKAFRKLYPQGFIQTEIVSCDGEIVVMKATAGYYEGTTPILLGTGTAFECKSSSFINKTSYIENCETSAIGRALGFLGFGVEGSIASAEEVINAIRNQGNDEQPPRTAQKGASQPAQVATVATVPPVPAKPQKAEKVEETKPAAEDVKQARKAAQMNPAAAYLVQAKAQLKQDMTDAFDFGKARAELIASGAVESVPSATITMDQAVDLIQKMYENYGHLRRAS